MNSCPWFHNMSFSTGISFCRIFSNYIFVTGNIRFHYFLSSLLQAHESPGRLQQFVTAAPGDASVRPPPSPGPDNPSGSSSGSHQMLACLNPCILVQDASSQ